MQRRLLHSCLVVERAGQHVLPADRAMPLHSVKVRNVHITQGVLKPLRAIQRTRYLENIYMR